MYVCVYVHMCGFTMTFVLIALNLNEKIQNFLLEITYVKEKAMTTKAYLKWLQTLLFKKSMDFERNRRAG